jgi:hypothetical protein
LSETKAPLVSQIEKQYEDGKSYMKQRRFLEKWPEYERFKAGDQWPPATDRTKSLPRPVFNIIDFIENHKISTVMNENVKMLFSPQESTDTDEMNPVAPQTQAIMEQAEQAADAFTRFSDTTWENIKQDELNEEALESAANIGTAIWHYYWDPSVKGGLTMPWVGEMCGEVLDPINVFFGNPQQRNVQKQPYIIVTNREMVETVRAEAAANRLDKMNVSLIVGDKDTQDEGYDSAKQELNDSSKVTVKTRYWKENGRIMFAKTASSQVVKKPTDTGFKLYPIAVLQWKRRKKSIHGIGDTEGIIPNQKAINFLLAMSVLSAQLTGWPKMKINPSFVDPNSINNDPSAPLIDMSPPGQSGAEYMNPGQMSGHVKDLIDTFIDYTKTLSSAQDAATGDVSSGNLNASAIMLLQKAAGVPIESIKKRFYRAMEDVGRIWEEFWKVKYNTTRRVNLKNDDGKEYSQDFKGTDYADVSMNLKIDIGPSSAYSEELAMASLDKLYDKQAITTEQYLKYAPKNVVPFKDRLMNDLEQQAQAQAQQQAMMEQQMAAMQPDPNMQAQQQAEMQAQQSQDDLQKKLVLNDQAHQHKMEQERLRGQNQAQIAAMKPVGGR